MSNRSKVTALVPAYQAAEFIQETLDSISLQKQEGFKVIISVDLCDDETYEICLQHASQDPRFKIFKQDKRLGYVGNCNFLLKQADSEYVLFAFHDDILNENYVEKLCSVLDNNSDVIMAYSDITKTFVNGETFYLRFRELDGINSKLLRGLIMIDPSRNWWIPNRGVFRLEESRKINGLKLHSEGEFSTDWPWLFHMSLLGQFQSVHEILCHKYYKKGSLSRNWAFSPNQWIAVYRAILKENWSSSISIFTKIGISIPLLLKLIRFWLFIQKQAFFKSFKKVY